MIMKAARLAVYEAVNVRHKHAQMLAMNLAEKLFGCCTRVAARNNNTQTSQSDLPKLNFSLSFKSNNLYKLYND